jgi:hypothetical protein
VAQGRAGRALTTLSKDRPLEDDFPQAEGPNGGGSRETILGLLKGELGGQVPTEHRWRWQGCARAAPLALHSFLGAITVC